MSFLEYWDLANYQYTIYTQPNKVAQYICIKAIQRDLVTDGVGVGVVGVVGVSITVVSVGVGL